jgi:hypothetical protein
VFSPRRPCGGFLVYVISRPSVFWISVDQEDFLCRSGWLALISVNDLSESHWIYVQYDLMIEYPDEGTYFIMVSRMSYEDIMPEIDFEYPECVQVDDFMYAQ